MTDTKATNPAAAQEKCFPVPEVPELSVCFEYAQAGINVWTKLGPIHITKVHIDKDGACEQLGGSKDGFSLKATACFHRKPDRIDLEADVSVPGKKPKKVKHTFNLSKS